MITKEKMPWCFIKFSQLILKGNVWRSVWRICMWISGLKGLICQRRVTFPATSFPGFSPTRTTPIGWVGENPGNEVAFSWSWILKDFIQVKKEEGKFVIVCPRPPQNVKLGGFTSQSCSGRRRNVLKAWCTCRAVVLIIKSIVFWSCHRCHRHSCLSSILVMTFWNLIENQ